MLLEDMYEGQLVALSLSYNGLSKGLKGKVLGYYKEEDKVLVKLYNKDKTEEKIPRKLLIGVLFN